MRFAPNALFVITGVTNWMTAAGLALIAGGLATLISFRSVLRGGGERRARRRQRRGGAAPAPAPAAVVALPAAPDEPAEEIVRPRRRGRRGRRRASAAAEADGRALTVDEVPEQGGLASIGLADDEDVISEDLIVVQEPEPLVVPEEVVAEPAVEQRCEPDPEPVAARSVNRSDLRYGDRVEGWVRPEYRTAPPDEPRSGEYWTPIPVDLAGDSEPSAKGYGWPLPVERLPAVPSYEPATGFDLVPLVSEPTEVVSVWATGDDRSGRIRLPRSWAGRNHKAEDADEPKRRPRPRPRPDGPADHNSTVYVSRHAAEPPR